MGYFQRIIETPYQRRVYTYTNQVPSDYKAIRDDYEKSIDGTKTDKSLKRTRDQLALTIQCNIQPYSKFITLTTAKNIKDRSEFINIFKDFRQAFKRKYGYLIKYSAVMETQKRGAWHIHMVAYNLTQKLDIKELDRLWQRIAGKGNLHLKVVDNHKNIFKYLIKYLTKEEMKINKKAVFSSRGLKRPTIVETRETFDYQKLDGKEHYSSSWLLYHGDQKDINTSNFDPKKMNQCTMQEWHRIK